MVYVAKDADIDERNFINNHSAKLLDRSSTLLLEFLAHFLAKAMVSVYYSAPPIWTTVSAVDYQYCYAVITTKSHLPEELLGISTW